MQSCLLGPPLQMIRWFSMFSDNDTVPRSHLTPLTPRCYCPRNPLGGKRNKRMQEIE